MILSIITINSKSFNISKVRFESKLVRINQNDIQSERDAEEVTTLSRPRPVVRHQASSPFQYPTRIAAIGVPRVLACPFVGRAHNLGTRWTICPIGKIQCTAP
jgi:hypothetical protein